MTSGGSNSIICLRINLPNFVHFKQYQLTNRDHGVPRIISFKAKFFSFHYCEYKQLKHYYGN